MQVAALADVRQFLRGQQPVGFGIAQRVIHVHDNGLGRIFARIHRAGCPPARRVAPRIQPTGFIHQVFLGVWPDLQHRLADPVALLRRIAVSVFQARAAHGSGHADFALGHRAVGVVPLDQRGRIPGEADFGVAGVAGNLLHAAGVKLQGLGFLGGKTVAAAADRIQAVAAGQLLAEALAFAGLIVDLIAAGNALQPLGAGTVRRDFHQEIGIATAGLAHPARAAIGIPLARLAAARAAHALLGQAGLGRFAARADPRAVAQRRVRGVVNQNAALGRIIDAVAGTAVNA